MISCDNLINLYKKNTEKESDKVFGVKLIAYNREDLGDACWAVEVYRCS